MAMAIYWEIFRVGTGRTGRSERRLLCRARRCRRRSRRSHRSLQWREASSTFEGDPMISCYEISMICEDWKATKGNIAKDISSIS